MASPSAPDDDAERSEVAGDDSSDHAESGRTDRSDDASSVRSGTRDGLAENGALALSAVGALVVAGFLLSTLQPLAYPLCQPLIQVVRGWPAVLGQYLPLLAGAAVLLGGTELSVRAAGRRRRALAAVAGGFGVAVFGRLVLAVGVCGAGALSGLGSRGMDVAVLVAVGAALAAGGWYRYAVE